MRTSWLWSSLGSAETARICEQDWKVGEFDTVCSLVQGQGLHSQSVCAAAMHEKQDNLMIIWDKVFNVLPNFYYQKTQHLGLICFFLKIPKRMVIT